MNNTKVKRVIVDRKELSVTRHWTNGFAQSCYELVDGTILYINYSDDFVTIVKTKLEVKL